MNPPLYVACERAVHVVTAEGKTLRAGIAVLFILERIGWGWFARALAMPPFIWCIEIGYHIFARNRHFFANFFFTKELPPPPDEEPNA